MSKDFVTADELAYLAKKRKELNVVDHLTTENKRKVKQWYDEALIKWAGVVTQKEEPLLEKATIKEMVYEEAQTLIDKIDAREMLAFQFTGQNKMGRHLVLLETFEIRPLVLDKENGELDLKSASVLGRIQETVIDDVEEVMAQHAKISGISTKVVFQKGQIWDKKSTLEFYETKEFSQLTALELTLVDQTVVRVWHLADLDYVDFVYSRLEPMDTSVEMPLEVEVAEEKREEVRSQPTLKVENPSVVSSMEKSMVHNVLNSNATEVVKPVFQAFGETPTSSKLADIELLNDIPLELSVVLGKTHKTVEEILNFNTGKVIELDKLADDPLEIYVNGKLVAEGEVVVVDENFGIKVTRLYKNNLGTKIK